MESQKILDQINMNQVDGEGNSLLILAAMNGNIQIIESILMRNPDLDIQNVIYL